LKQALASGLDAGVSVNEFKEVLVQVYAYCGFPRSLNALNTLRALADERGSQDAAGPLPGPMPAGKSLDFGTANQTKLIGREVKGGIYDFAPAIDEYLKAHLFGDIFGRDNLDWKTRELATIAMLAAMTGTENQLKSHIAVGRRNGLTDSQVEAILAIVRSEVKGETPAVADAPKTFPASDNVTVEKVFYKNHFDITLAGELYLPVGLDKTQKHAAIIVGHPYGGVKEQCSGLYAQELAKRGFAALAFDLSFSGESGGTPRRTVSPEIYADDFSASVDYLGRLPFIDRKRIGVIGICGSGGFSLAAAAIDPRIRALATVSMYDMGRATRQGLNDSISLEQRKKNLEALAEQRWKEADGGEVLVRFGTPEKLPENPSPAVRAFYDYYRGRAYHPRYLGQKVTSAMALMNFYPFARIAEISPRPLLFVAGEKAHSRYFSEDAYRQAAEPKELYIVPNAGHVDLYDQTDKIPFDKLTDFFTKNLN